jgi:hypothetical protein
MSLDDFSREYEQQPYELVDGEKILLMPNFGVKVSALFGD